MPPRNFSYFWQGTFSLGIFLILLIMVARQTFSSVDLFVTTGLQSLLPRFVDEPLSLFSIMGNFEVLLLATFFLGLFIYKKKKILPLSFGLFFFIFIFEFIGKRLIFHPHPSLDLLRFTLPFTFPAIHVEIPNSFPSGHVGRTIFLAILCSYFVNKFSQRLVSKFFLQVVIFLFSFLMIISRIYLGEHWFSDVLGGFLLGASMGLFALVYY